MSKDLERALNRLANSKTGAIEMGVGFFAVSGSILTVVGIFILSLLWRALWGTMILNMTIPVVYPPFPIPITLINVSAVMLTIGALQPLHKSEANWKALIFGMPIFTAAVWVFMSIFT